MDNRNYIEELKTSLNFNDPKFIEGFEEALNAVFYIAHEAGIDLGSLPKFLELQDFVQAHLKDL